MSEKYELEEGTDKSTGDPESDKNAHDASGKGQKFAKPTGSRIPARLADKNGSDPVYSKRQSVPTSVVPGQEGAQRGMTEELMAVFAGADLSEDFVEKATTIFEAAVNERVSILEEALVEAYEAQLEEEFEGAIADLVEKIDDYLDYAVSHYMEENALAIERGIQVEMAESFMIGLRDLFVEHNVELDDKSIDLLAGLSEEVESLEEQLNEAIEENIELRRSLNEAAAAEVFAEVAEGLSMAQSEKFATLIEGVDYDDLDEFKQKLSVVKENYFGAKNKKVISEGFDNEPLELIEEKFVDPSIAAVAAAISKSVKK